MRNLLSFVLGVLSRLLYVCLRLILLLDRAVCFVRDLPVRRHIAALLRAAGRRRAVCAAVVFVPLFVLPGLLLTRSGMLILADGQPLGVVSDSAVLLDAANEIERSASALSGADYYLPMALAAKPVRTAAPLLSQSKLEQNLIAASGELDTLAVISVDGKRAAIAAGTADAQAVLEQIKAACTTDDDRNVHFVQAVRVDSAVAPSRLAAQNAALYDTLSACLDVTATRSVTYTEAIPFRTVTQENDSLDQTYRATIRQGCAGTAQITAEIETVDGKEQSRTILARTVLSQATNEIVEVGTRNIGIGTGEFAVPVSGYTFTSAFKYRWGRLHGGVDLAVSEGTPVYAADNGKVIVAEDSGNGYGNYVILDHQNGFKTLYGHNSQLLVSVGDVVSKGDKIAFSGNTGNSTGPHLHFEVQVNDEKVDPTQYLKLE